MLNEKNEKRMYFAGIIPDEKTSLEIREFKEEALKRFGVKSAMKSEAHITLISPFTCEDEILEKSEYLKKYLAEQKKFSIRVDGFSFFGKRTIFADVIKDEKFVEFFYQMGHSLKEQFKFDSREFSPHITIINRDLKDEKNFESAWKYFSGIEYERVFTAEKIILFRHTGKEWERFKIFELE